MSKEGGEVPERDVMDYKTPRGPRNMNVRPEVYRHGSQGPTPCDNSESGTPGQLNTRVLPDGLDQDDFGGRHEG